jgi:hypothetical protein
MQYYKTLHTYPKLTINNYKSNYYVKSIKSKKALGILFC